MKLRDLQDLHKRPEAELRLMLSEKRAKLRTRRFDIQAGKAKNIGELRALRQDIARILTCLAEIKNK